MPIAKEGAREILLASLVLAALAGLGYWLYWPLAVPFVILWLWVLSFFRDPKRQRCYQPGDLCSPADGTVTEITELEHYESLNGPAIRIGIFLSLFNVHVNRSPCSGTVRQVSYRAGEFLDARDPQAGLRNESNTLLIDPDSPLPGPVEVRQVAGMVARRIINHVRGNEHMPIGYRFGMIKFGSRTELIIPKLPDTVVLVNIGDKVHGGLTILARQNVGTVAVSHSRPLAKEFTHSPSNV